MAPRVFVARRLPVDAAGPLVLISVQTVPMAAPGEGGAVRQCHSALRTFSDP